MKYDRRYNERYPLPGATVLYRINSERATETPVKDITHGGVCFEFSHSTDVGSQLEIEISIPGKDSLILKGNIIWTALEGTDTPGYAAMQFLPFGTDNRYNTMENHDKLRDVILECIEQNPPNIKFKL